MTFEHKIQVAWDNQSTPWWNETCANVIEVFGLPGHRFNWTPHTDYMVFGFESKKDAELCKILLSDRI